MCINLLYYSLLCSKAGNILIKEILCSFPYIITGHIKFICISINLCITEENPGSCKSGSNGLSSFYFYPYIIAIKGIFKGITT